MGGGAPRSSGPGGEVVPLRGAMIFLQRKINTLPQGFPSKPEDPFLMTFFFPPRRRGCERRFFLSLKPSFSVPLARLWPV